MRNQKLLCPFFSNDWDKIQYVATTCWFVEAGSEVIVNT